MQLAAAAKPGHLLAAYDLALLYMEGQLFPQDFTRAAELLRTAAQAGLPEAQYALGTHYKQGRGVAKDMKEATRLWGLAALADNADAQVEFGIALFNGDGVTKNEQAAAVIFRQAALHGNGVAQDRLARILAEGRGAPKNPVEATKWHLISKARGETNLTCRSDWKLKLVSHLALSLLSPRPAWRWRLQRSDGVRLPTASATLDLGFDFWIKCARPRVF